MEPSKKLEEMQKPADMPMFDDQEDEVPGENPSKRRLVLQSPRMDSEAEEIKE